MKNTTIITLSNNERKLLYSQLLTNYETYYTGFEHHTKEICLELKSLKTILLKIAKTKKEISELTEFFNRYSL